MAYSKIILNGETLMDVTSDTVAAGSLLSGKTATKNDGTKVTGNISTKTSSDLTVSGATVTAPAGYYSASASKAVATGTATTPTKTITTNPTITLSTTTGVVTATYAGSSSITPTVSAGYVTTGTAGTISTTGTSTYQLTMRSAADMTVAAQSVTAPAGYYSQNTTKAVATTTHPNPTAEIASSTGVVTATHAQTTGYVTSGTTTGTLNLTTQAAQTINTSTADQTVASYQWLTGAQTIKSVTTTNLTAANIAEGVTVKVGDANKASRIAQVTGTYSEDGRYMFYITQDANNTSSNSINYNSKTYNTTGDSKKFNSGDSMTIYASSTHGDAQIYIDGVLVADSNQGSSISYTYNPTTSFEIKWTVSSTNSVCEITTYKCPVGYQAGTTITPTEASQLAVSSGYYTNGSVYVGAISSTYVGTGVARKSSADTTFASATGTFTAPIGYYSSAATKTITTQAAQTIYPSTADQTIASYKWLTGAQTIKSVTTSNLTASNIAEGVIVKVGDATNASRITQVTGTHTGGTQRTFTITGTGKSTTCYIQHNNIKYYSAGSFLFKSGDIANLYVYGNSATFKHASVTINDVSVHNAYSTYSSAYTLPDCNITANLLANSDDCGLSMNYSTIDISESGGYDVCDYGWANVNISTTPMPYYSIYQVLATSRHLYVDNYSDIQEWANSYSQFSNMQFAGLTITGSLTFNSIKSDFGTFGVFGSVSCGLRNTVFDGSASYNFPELSYGIGQGWFYNNCNIKSINAPKCKFIGSSAFYNCTILRDVSISSCISIYDKAFELCVLLSSVNFPSCTWVRASAFSNCTQLQTANFSACTKLGNNAFFNCTNLSSISFPNCSMIGTLAFWSCRTLTIVDFPNCVSIEASAFCSCSGLTTAIFSSCQIISSSAFYNCYMLSNISFPICSTIGSCAFQNCSSLTTVNFSNCSMIGMSAFARCSNLTSVNIPNCSSIGTYAFQSCYNLTTINATACQYVGGNAFNYCSSLTAINLQSCSVIGTYTFEYCKELSIVSIPICGNVPNYAFRGCYNLISLYLNSVSSVPSLGTGAFASTPISTYSASAGRYGSVFVPASLYNDFITHASWKAYSARIVSV